MKESNEIIIKVQDYQDRVDLAKVLIHNGYEVTVNTIDDAMGTVRRWYYIVAHKLV